MNTTVPAMYIEGIKEGREKLRKFGAVVASEELDGLNRTIKGFDAGSPVGQLLRGERDFWRAQVKRAAR